MKAKAISDQKKEASTQHNFWFVSVFNHGLVPSFVKHRETTIIWESLGLDWMAANSHSLSPGDSVILFNFDRRTVNVTEVLEVCPKEAEQHSHLIAFKSVEGFPIRLTLDLALILKSKGLINNLYDLRLNRGVHPETYNKLKEALDQWKADRQPKKSIQT